MYSIRREYIIVIVVSIFVNGEIRVSLNSDTVNWYLRNGNNSINTEARVPGGVYTDLQNAGIISKNLFYRFNDIDYRWVGRDNWIYRTHFNLSSNITNKSTINLVLHGVDTLAEIYLNRQLVGLTKNMFVRYVFPVKGNIKEANNIIEIKLKSPIVESEKLFVSHNYTVPPTCVPLHYNGECHVNFLRKMQASFAWDWGPAFPSMGLWKSVEIEAFNTAIIRDVTTKVEQFNTTAWKINATVYLETSNGTVDDFQLQGVILTEKFAFPESSRQCNGENRLVCFLIFIPPKESLELWWPNGFGNQPLYQINITFQSKESSEISQRELKLGIRTVELIQEKIRPSKNGLTFYFKVNGVPIFAKGSNWIPSHILPELSYNASRIRSLLQSAADAHMNMLRVWGGGLYESDLFYEIADKLGIMIWQDMMFACSMYPTNDEFLDIVKIETEQQVRRLQHHPSIVLWAGNNENEAALRGNWYSTADNFQLYKDDYIKLYVDTIRPVVLSNDNTRSYLVSSPSNGIVSEMEGYIASNPYSPLYGDTHFYNYILDSWNSNTFPNTRFASEYGYQSLPSFKTMSQVTLPQDRSISSQFSTNRQHLLAGYFFMVLQMKLRLPHQIRNETEEDYSNFIYYSQVVQAMGVKTETEKYRRDRNKLTKSNEGRTMGAMYWQLNDVWQAPSWSSIDFDGRWKMLHYYAKKFFAPVLVSLDLTMDNYLNIFIISDLLTDIHGADMSLRIYSWENTEPNKVISSTEIIRNSRSKLYGRYAMTELMNAAECSETSCFIYVTLTAPEINLDVDNILFPVPFSKVTNLKPANITVSIKKSPENIILVELQTQVIAPFVWLETDELGEFSDNGFILIRNKTLKFSNGKDAVDIDKLRDTLTVRSLLRA